MKFHHHGARYIFTWLISTCNDFIYTPLVQLATGYSSGYWIVIACLYGLSLVCMVIKVKNWCKSHDLAARLARIEEQLNRPEQQRLAVRRNEPPNEHEHND